MATVHEFQYTVIKRLDSHTDAVHSEPHKSLHVGYTFFDYIFRIDLYGKFLIGSSMSDLNQSIQETF